MAFATFGHKIPSPYISVFVGPEFDAKAFGVAEALGPVVLLARNGLCVIIFCGEAVRWWGCFLTKNFLLSNENMFTLPFDKNGLEPSFLKKI